MSRVSSSDSGSTGTGSKSVAPGLVYQRSLFERCMAGGVSVIMLKEQHRMHPAIRHWPGLYFYDGQLTEAEGVSTTTRGATYHSHAPCFAPYQIVDVPSVEDTQRASVGNMLEAEMVASLVVHWMQIQRGTETADCLRNVAVLSPYRRQVSWLVS
jgi:superfamily I DNA and/or RNA helicase